MSDKRARRVFVLGNMEDLSIDTLTRGRHYWVKGFLRLGCDVQVFSYRQAMSRSSPLGNRTLGRFLSRRKVNHALITQTRSYSPDIVLIAGMRLKGVGGQLLAAMREVAPGATFVGMEYDWLWELDPIRTEVARHVDWVLATSAGSFLQTYKAAGAPRCAYMPNSCDPDIQYRYDVRDEWRSDILWTGKLRHDEVPPNPEREALLTRLAQRKDARLYGCFGRPPVSGLDYFRAISGARIALSINIMNDVRLCHSNRFLNNIACGALTLAKRVPDSDLLFEDKVHVRYFDTVEEFFELADWYVRHDDERERIARAGMEHAHREFNCEKMARHLLGLVEKGRIDAPWAEIV